MCALVLFAAPAFAQAPFYQGKTITVIASTAPGGTGDMRVKAFVPFLRKYVPGNPTVLIEYMDGGGGRKGANYLFRSARADGLTVGALSGGVIAQAPSSTTSHRRIQASHNDFQKFRGNGSRMLCC